MIADDIAVELARATALTGRARVADREAAGRAGAARRLRIQGLSARKVGSILGLFYQRGQQLIVGAR